MNVLMQGMVRNGTRTVPGIKYLKSVHPKDHHDKNNDQDQAEDIGKDSPPVCCNSTCKQRIKKLLNQKERPVPQTFCDGRSFFIVETFIRFKFVQCCSIKISRFDICRIIGSP